MSVLPTGTIISNINSELADNNAGLISAYDVRHNMVDITESITYVVANGNFDSDTPFVGSNVRAKIVSDQYGMFIAESGIVFPNNGNTTQYTAYPGANNISHNDLADLAADDPHPQYVNIDGTHLMTGNLGIGNEWINESGNASILSTDERGIKFKSIDSNNETMYVGNKTTVEFTTDNSQMNTGKGLAQAWISFNGSGNMNVLSSYNVSKLQRTGSPGKFKVFFTSGLFSDANYVAVGNSNSRSDNDAAEDFDVNTVGIVERDANYVTFYVLNDAGNYVDAAVNDLVIFGNADGVTGDSSPTLEIL